MANNNQQQNETKSVYSAATIVYSSDGTDDQVHIDCHPNHVLCSHCGDMEEDGDLIKWDCDVCSGGVAKIVSKVFTAH